MKILTLLVAWLCVSVPVSAQTIWTDGFESGTYAGPFGQMPTNWTAYDGAGASNGSFTVDCSVSHAGNCSLRMNYDDISTGQGPFMDRRFPNQNNMYLRFWVRASPGFKFAANFTKLAYAPRCESHCVAGTPSWILTADPQIQWHGQGVPGDPDVQLYPTGRSVTSTWSCVEQNVNLAGGSVTLWVNDEQRFHRSGMATTAAMTDDIWRMYRERGVGSLYYDDFVVSTSRIGCGGSSPPPPPPSDTTPPGQVQGVTVQ